MRVCGVDLQGKSDNEEKGNERHRNSEECQESLGAESYGPNNSS